MAGSRIRRRSLSASEGEAFMGVCLECNHRTQWFKGEDTAQNHVDQHIESKHSGKRRKAKREGGDAAETPGGQDTGPRGESES